ncbi:MAG: hypothetical protein ACQETH_15775 [Candidatus Rifleibacteriota bacterium]
MNSTALALEPSEQSDDSQFFSEQDKKTSSENQIPRLFKENANKTEGTIDKSLRKLPVVCGSNQAEESEVDSLKSYAQEIKANNISNVKQMYTPEDEKSFEAKRVELVERKYENGLTRKEEIELKKVSWILDQIEYSRCGEYYDKLEQVVDEYHNKIEKVFRKINSLKCNY